MMYVLGFVMVAVTLVSPSLFIVLAITGDPMAWRFGFWGMVAANVVQGIGRSIER